MIFHTPGLFFLSQIYYNKAQRVVYRFGMKIARK